MSQLRPTSEVDKATPQLAERLNLFDATMIVMGGIVGAGIFVNPAIVARQIHQSKWILAAWALGGLIALAGAFIYAELAVYRPQVGGQYAYLRDAYHPLVAFVYGWTLLLVIQTGGMAAVAVTFARYFVEVTGAAIQDWLVAAITLFILVVINCLGVRAGGTVQSVLMVLKIIAIATLVICGLLPLGVSSVRPAPVSTALEEISLITFGAAMVPVVFAYGGWQTAGFVSSEIREPRKNLPRGLLLGVTGVILLYLAVNYVCVRSLGADGLAASSAPAAEVMKLALGTTGARIIAVAVAVSTLGFLSQGMLTGPRVYFAMAEDGLFFKSIAHLHSRSRAPVAAIALQGIMAIAIALSGKYEQILNYVVSADFIFFGLTGLCIFVFRRDKAKTKHKQAGFRIPGHPLTTIFFVLASWTIVGNTIYKYPF
ncbi:MAG: amino acid permease, partial [Acidobacteriota bacterium]